MDLSFIIITSVITASFYWYGVYNGKKMARPQALEAIRHRLTWAKSISAYVTYRTLWPKAGYTSEDDAHEAGFMAGWNAKEQSPTEICEKD